MLSMRHRERARQPVAGRPVPGRAGNGRPPLYPDLPVHRAVRLDDLLEGDGRLSLRARAVRIAGFDEHDAGTVPAVAADPGELAGADPQLVGAVLPDGGQTAPRVELLRAVAAGMPDLEWPAGEHDLADPAAPLVYTARGE